MLPRRLDPPAHESLAEEAAAFLSRHGCDRTAIHAAAVAEVAHDLAQQFGVEEGAAGAAGWLHDISAVVPSYARLATARRWGLEILPQEIAAPMILHQKLSAVMARQLFGIRDARVLWAIRCHTTLRVDATQLDKIVFVADKIAWDQPGRPPYLTALEAALTSSLDAGVCVYLSSLWAQRTSLPVVHPWLEAAYRQLCTTQSKGFRIP
ncbi:MAG: bis(5'-nucleosyl)-tetraphosphatase (symmetrical) YqeK [Anaerolineae bacterium]